MQNNSVGVRSAAQRQALAPRVRAAFGGAPVSRQWASAAASRRRERPAPSALPRGRSADLGCPYEVLGLPPGTSDEAAVKRAYRKLAKKYHPDVLLNSSQHAAAQPHQPAQTPTPQQATEEPHQHAEHPVQFLSIAEAYSFIMERLRNGVAADGVSPRPGNSRAFHEWMWEFRMRRTWQRQQRQAAAATPPGAGSDADDEEPVAEDACGCSDSPTGMGMNGGAAAAGAHHAVPQSAEGLRSQLAGLRHRAAIRKNRPPTPSPAGSASEADEPSSPPAVHPAFERGAGTWFAAATGPSDSADPSPAAAAAAAHAAAVEAEHAVGGAAAAAKQPAPEQGGVEGHEAAAAAGGARRRFASNSTVREALREQLSGMRRKAALRERIYSGSGGGGVPEAGFDGVAA